MCTTKHGPERVVRKLVTTCKFSMVQWTEVQRTSYYSWRLFYKNIGVAEEKLQKSDFGLGLAYQVSCKWTQIPTPPCWSGTKLIFSREVILFTIWHNRNMHAAVAPIEIWRATFYTKVTEWTVLNQEKFAWDRDLYVFTFRSFSYVFRSYRTKKLFTLNLYRQTPPEQSDTDPKPVCHFNPPLLRIIYVVWHFDSCIHLWINVSTTSRLRVFEEKEERIFCTYAQF